MSDILKLSVFTAANMYTKQTFMSRSFHFLQFKYIFSFKKTQILLKMHTDSVIRRCHYASEVSALTDKAQWSVRVQECGTGKGVSYIDAQNRSLEAKCFLISQKSIYSHSFESSWQNQWLKQAGLFLKKTPKNSQVVTQRGESK